MQIVLFVAGLISGFVVQQWGAAVVLVLVTVANALLGMRQEGKAEASIAALQKMMIIKAKVRRDRQLTELPAEQVVPGDIVLLDAGDRVPADGRIIKSATLEIAEAPLTGESVPVAKTVEPVASAETPLGDRIDMAYMNTEVHARLRRDPGDGDRHVDRGRAHLRDAADGEGSRRHRSRSSSTP